MIAGRKTLSTQNNFLNIDLSLEEEKEKEQDLDGN
jgi:hypothetical protein